VARLGANEITFVQVWQLMDLAPWAESGWRGSLRNRTLFEAGIHLLDLIVALYGEAPVSVQASISTGGLREEQTDAVVTATLEFSRGRLAQVVQNRLCLGETQYFEVRADTTGGSLRASFGGRARLSLGLLHSPRPHARFEYGNSGLAWREQGGRRTILGRNGKDPGMAATRDLTRANLAAFASGTTPPVDGASARALLDVIIACYRAAETGQRVSLDGRSPAPAGGPPR
jgi:predicted dehydrogenase